MRFDAIDRLERNTRRVAEIAGVFAKYGLADYLKGIHYSRLQEWLQNKEGQAINELSPAERLRLAFTDLGPTFIKLGQMLSTRPDVVGHEVADELTKLQTRAPSDPPEVARATVTAELGRPPEEVFAVFEEEAFASASIAQVHRARLNTGEEVVVKIQHHGIQPKIEADLAILAGLAELAEKHSVELRQVQPVGLVRQFRKSILQELDFQHERRNIEEFTRNFVSDDTVHFPRVWPAASARRVLTMERLDGITGTDSAGLETSGVDLAEFARHGANMFLEMIFRDSFYHADPHPGNLMLLRGGGVGVMDCGMTGRLDDDLRDNIEAMLLAIAQQDSVALADTVLRLSSPVTEVPRDQLRADLTEFVSDYTGQSISELDLGAALLALTDIIRRNHIVLPPGASLLLRTLVLLEGTSQRLNPSFSLSEVIAPFYRRALGRHLSPKRLLARLHHTWRDWDRLLQSLPRDLNETLQRMRDGRFKVHLDLQHLDPVVNRLVMGIVTASLFLGSSLLWSMKAAPLVGGVSVVGAVGYLISVYFGWRLLRAIKKTGNVDSKDR